MKLLKIFTAVIAIVSLSSFVWPKHHDNWRRIGDKVAAFGPDRDVLHVTGNDNYRQVVVRVTGAPLYIEDMDIYFDNGEKMNVVLRNRFKQGSESRVIDLPGGSRNLKKVTFLYSTKGRDKGRATVAVWGRR